MSNKISLEDLVPKELTEEHKKELDELRKNPKEYIEVCKEVQEILMDEVWLDIVYNKIKINYHDLKGDDVQRLMYGSMIQKNYIFNEK